MCWLTTKIEQFGWGLFLAVRILRKIPFYAVSAANHFITVLINVTIKG